MKPIRNILERAWHSRGAWRGCIVAGAVFTAMGISGPGAAAAEDELAVGAVNANAYGDNLEALALKDETLKKQGPFVKISGTVTNSLTGLGVGGANVTFAATLVSYSVVTDTNGDYSEKLPIVTGGYDVSFEATNYNTLTLPSLSLAKGKSELDAVLDPLAPVIVHAWTVGDAAPDVAVTAMGSWTIMDGSDFIGAQWTQSEGATATIGQPDAATTSVALPPAGDFKAELIHLLREPPVGADELPPNVEVPPGEFVGGLQDRFQVVGINHLALERAGHVALHFSVTTTSGIYAADVDLHAALDWRVNPGIRNVPVDATVLLYGKEQASYDWALTGIPSGSVAMLMDSLSRTPEFIPDEPGLYTVTEIYSGAALEIHAGTWRGIIVGQDANGRPLADSACTGCHSGGFAPDTFSTWKETGHAEIFTNNLNANDHYGEGCFGCHTVGFDPEAQNGGIDEALDYDAFIMSDLLPTTAPDNWTRMLAEFPLSAKLANIQCENCHGPQTGPFGGNSTAHAGGVFLPDEPRLSLASDVCASCHGEPLRHARFQQWQLSRHSNYELAIDESQTVTARGATQATVS